MSKLDRLVAGQRRSGWRPVAWLVMLLIAAGIAWASVAELDEVAVAPGEIETAMIGEEYEALIPRIPMHRMGRPEEVASAVFRLCTEDFGYVTGTEVFVTGGQHLY